MNLQILCHAANIACDLSDIEIKGIKSNSEKVEQGDLFVCVKGINKDGHDYIEDAVKRGAAAIISEREASADVPVLCANNTRKALPLLYDAWYGYPSKKLKLVAVTGTNGKTSVTYLLKAIFDAAMYTTGLIGTVDSYLGDRKIERMSPSATANMTTPDPEELFRQLAVMAEGGAEYVFMEASSHALALDKLEGLEFEAAVFTNLTPEHLDFHKDMEDYFSAKAKLFERAKKKIINTDDKYGKRLRDKYKDSSFGCSITGKCCDFFADDIRDAGVDGSEYYLVSRTKQFLVRTPLIGRFNVMNTLESAVVALALGTPSHSIKETLASFSGIEGRLERVKISGRADFSVYIDYAHTPDALENLLRTARSLASRSQRIVLLFGCGGDRDRGKRAEMGKIALSMADFVIITADNSRSEETSDIINDIVSGLDGESAYTIIEDRRAAIEYAVKNARRGDIILLAGKGHENYEIDAYGKKPFSEKDYVKFYVNKYHER